MRRGRGFVYSTTAADKDASSESTSSSASRLYSTTTTKPNKACRPSRPSRPQTSGNMEQQSSSSLYGRSPLKRKRSPESDPLSSARGSRGSGDRSGEGIEVRLLAKVAKTEEDTFEEDDELDDLGAAALEQYELTQREPAQSGHSRKSPTPVSDPILDIPVSHSIPTRTSSNKSLDSQKYTVGSAQGKMGRGNWHNPYRETVGVSSVTTGNNIGGAVATMAESNKDYGEKVKQLQEENFTKDGEVKVLRGEKERLMGELRKKDEQMNNIQTTLVLEKHMIEEQLTKEREALATKLQFRDQELQAKEQKLQAKEQELIKLRQKLEQQRNTGGLSLASSPLTLSSTSRSRQTATGRSEFLSTETFMPLSQMGGGNVTPVQVGQKRGIRGVADVKDEEREKDTQKRATKRSSKSPSISPSSGRGAVGGANSTATLAGRGGDESSRTVRTPSVNQLESRERQTAQDKSVGNRATQERQYPEFVLNTSHEEPTGAQLLMLLVQRDLLKIPPVQRHQGLPLDNDDKIEEDESSESLQLSSQLSTESQPRSIIDSTRQHGHNKLPGLLSLLHLSSRNHPTASSAAMPQFSSSSSSGNSFRSSCGDSSLSLGSQSSEELLGPPSVPGAAAPPQFNMDGGSSSGAPSAETTAVTTPARRSKLQLAKPHTLARTDLTRARTQQQHHPPSDLIRSLSAASSPNYRLGAGQNPFEDRNSSSLINSINMKKLEKSIAALLRTADSPMETPIVSASSKQFGNYSSCDLSLLSSLSSSRSQLLDPSSTSVVSLLKQIGGIICQYFNEQQIRAQALSSSSNTSGFLVDLGNGEHSDTPGSLGTSSSMSSKTSSDLSLPLKGDQQLATQALDLLETLATYSKTVRDQILLKPPEFYIPDSRPSSSLGVHSEDSETGGESLTIQSCEKLQATQSTTMFHTIQEDLMKVSTRLSYFQSEPMAEPSPARRGELVPPQPPAPCQVSMSWKGIPLVQMRSQKSRLGVSSKVWIRCENADTAEFTTRQSSCQSSPGPVHIRPGGSSSGQLFPILLELPVPQWRESLENVNTCLRILTVLAEDCPLETLQRFSPLFHDDKLDICLEKDDPQLTLSVLILLSRLVRLPDVAALLCYHTNPCLLLTCYQLLVDPPPSNNSDVIFRIRLHIVRLVAQVLLNKNGSKVLFEKCSCSHELLKSLVTLLHKLLDGFYQFSQFTQQQLLLIKETILLMFVISVHDPFFDTHREQCEHIYVFVLNSLSYLFTTTDEESQEASLLQELLDYCDEYEDSGSSSNSSDHEMDHGDNAGTGNRK